MIMQFLLLALSVIFRYLNSCSAIHQSLLPRENNIPRLNNMEAFDFNLTVHNAGNTCDDRKKVVVTLARCRHKIKLKRFLILFHAFPVLQLFWIIIDFVLFWIPHIYNLNWINFHSLRFRRPKLSSKSLVTRAPMLRKHFQI